MRRSIRGTPARSGAGGGCRFWRASPPVGGDPDRGLRASGSLRETVKVFVVAAQNDLGTEAGQLAIARGVRHGQGSGHIAGDPAGDLPKRGDGLGRARFDQGRDSGTAGLDFGLHRTQRVNLQLPRMHGWARAWVVHADMRQSKSALASPTFEGPLEPPPIFLPRKKALPVARQRLANFAVKCAVTSSGRRGGIPRRRRQRHVRGRPCLRRV